MTRPGSYGRCWIGAAPSKPSHSGQAEVHAQPRRERGDADDNPTGWVAKTVLRRQRPEG